PDLVCIAMRQSAYHHPIALAAIRAGAHVYCEKPFTTTPAEADELLAAADRGNRRVAVAHTLRMSPAMVRLKQALNEGLLGDLIELRAHGKQDTRAGGEDMIVLGTHLFDLMRMFAGDALRCSATIWTRQRLAKLEDRKNATEKIGPILGDEIEAQFEFEKGVLGTFVSRARLREAIGRWRLQLVGTK